MTVTRKLFASTLFYLTQTLGTTTVSYTFFQPKRSAQNPSRFEAAQPEKKTKRHLALGYGAIPHLDLASKA